MTMAPRGLLPPLFGFPWEQAPEPPGETKTQIAAAGKREPLAPKPPIRTDLLPEGWSLKVVPTTPESGMPGGDVDFAGKIIRLHNEKSAKRPDIVNHEIAHVLLQTRLPWPTKWRAFFDDYEKTRPLRPEIRKTGYHAEYAADDLAQYFSDPTALKPELRAVFSKYFPDIAPAALPPSPITAEAPMAAQPPAPPDDYGIVMRKRGRDPTWLNKYKQRLAEANKVAAERTQHLKGADRVRAMNQIVRDLLRADRGTKA